MSKFTQFVMFLLVLAIVVTPFVLATVGNNAAGEPVAAGDPMFHAVINADGFEAPNYVNTADGVISYRIAISGGNRVGAAFEVSVPGFIAPIRFVVGVYSNGTVSGIEIIEHNETPAFWDMVENAGFIDGLVGNTTATPLDAVSNATVTSEALFNGTQAALNFYINNIATEEPEVAEEPEAEEDTAVAEEPPAVAEEPLVAAGPMFHAVINADGFRAPNYVNAGGIVSYRIAISGGNRVGAAFEVSVPGYIAPIRFVVGVHSNGTVSGISIIEHNETPAFWGMVENAGFIDGLVGNAIGARLDAVSDATVTSEALFNGTQAALNFYVNNLR